MARRSLDDLDWSDLETFEALGFKLRPPEVNISQTFTFNSGFVHRAKKQIGDKRYALLSYSRKNEAIIFEFVDNADTPGAIKMVKGGNVSFAGRSFFNYYNIDPNDIKGKYTPELRNIPKKGNCWVIFLRKKKSILQ